MSAKPKTSTESLIDKLDRVQSDLSSGLLTGGLGNNIAVIKENMSADMTTMVDVGISSTTSATTKAPYPLVNIRKFSPANRPSTTKRPKTSAKPEELTGLLPPGFKPKYSGKKSTTQFSVDVNEPQSDQPKVDLSQFIPPGYKLKGSDDKSSKLLEEILSKVKKANEEEKAEVEEKSEEKTTESIFKNTKADDISKFLPPGYKLPKSDEKTTESSIFKNTKADDISKFLPPGYKLPKSEEKTTEASIFKNTKADDISKFLPPGYKLPKTTTESSVFKNTKADDISKFLPPGYKLPRTTTAKPTSEPAGPKIKPLEDISALLPPGYKAPKDESSNGPFVIVWKRGTTLLSAGQQIISMDPRISLIGYNLQLKDIRHADQGDYTCQIGDGTQGDLIHTIEILMPPSIQILPPNGQVVTRKGGPVSFECKANGNPTPTVQWSKKDGLLPSGLQVETGYLLNLNEVRRQDGGNYQCTASNGIGQPVTGEIRLHVLYPPEVSVLRSWVNSGEGLEAKLDCIVHADPPAEVMWYQDSFVLQPTDRRLVSKKGNTHTLTIRNVQLSDFGNYSCVVSNSIGRDKRYIELSGKPGPAKIISSQYSNPHEYDLKWVVQSVFPITEVRILYRRIMVNSSYHYPGQWHDVSVTPSQSYNAATSERTQRYLLKNLQADSVYECLVQSKNQHGYGELSDLHQWFTSPRGRSIVENSSTSVLYARRQLEVLAFCMIGLIIDQRA